MLPISARSPLAPAAVGDHVPVAPGAPRLWRPGRGPLPTRHRPFAGGLPGNQARAPHPRRAPAVALRAACGGSGAGGPVGGLAPAGAGVAAHPAVGGACVPAAGVGPGRVLTVRRRRT